LACLSRGQAWCTYDELSTDTLANRIILTTLRRLASERSLDRRSAESLRDLCRRMPGVTPVSITDGLFRRVRVTANRSTYGFILDVCELVHRNLLVSETSGDVVFRDFTRDDQQMAALFEAFLRRFYAREQRAFVVSAPTLQWDAEGAPESLALLPIMRTDIVLESPTRTIVMDAKYYAEALTQRFDKTSIRAGHLYQMASYMRHVALTRPSGTVEGVLIYPRVTESVRVDLTLHGQRVRVVG
jgi:5-methylcytosine-specific restriction enzyme subunit McrC